MQDLINQFKAQSATLTQRMKAAIAQLEKGQFPSKKESALLQEAFTALSAAYSEIENKSRGILTLEEGEDKHTIFEIEKQWNEYQQSKQYEEIILTLKKFIRVYSEDTAYQNALQPSIDAANALLDDFNAENASALPIHSYELVLKSIDGSKLEDAEEDEIYEKLDAKVLIGLQRKKYKLKGEIEEAPQTEEKPEMAKPETEAETTRAEVEAESHGKPEEEKSEEIEFISPTQPLKAPKNISRKEFAEDLGKFQPVLPVLSRNIGCLQVASIQMITEFFMGCTADQIKPVLDKLQAKGYFASYLLPYKGEKILLYCSTLQLKQCLQKDSLVQLITSHEHGNDKLYTADFIAQEKASTAELIERYERAEDVCALFRMGSNQQEILPHILCNWSEKRNCHFGDITIKDRGKIKDITFLFNHEGKTLSVPEDAKNIFIANYANQPVPIDQLGSREGFQTFSYSKDSLVELIEGKWFPVEENRKPIKTKAEAHQEKPEITTHKEEETQKPESKPDTASNMPVSAPAPKHEDKKEENNVLNHATKIESRTGTGEPEPEEANEPENYRTYYEKAMEAFIKGMPWAGMTLLHALGQESPDILIQTERFGYALGDPMIERDNRFLHLQSAFSDSFGNSFCYDTLALAAYLRLYFSPQCIIDPYSINSTDYLENNLMLEESSTAKNLIYKLAKFVGKHAQGIDDTLLGKALHHQSEDEQITVVSKNAQKWLEERTKCTWGKTSIKNARKKLLGDDSEINKMLQTVAANKKNEADNVKNAIKDYYHGNGIDSEGIRELVLDVADKFEGDSPTSYTGSDISYLLKDVTEPIEIISQWLELVQNKHAERADLIDDTEKLIRDCLPDLEALSTAELSFWESDKDVLAAYKIFKDTAAYLVKRLNGDLTQEDYKRNFYIDLLRAPYVALAENRMPIIEKPEEQIAPLDFCKNAAHYVDEELPGWKEAIDKIFKFTPDRKCFDFGNAEIIHKYLIETDQEKLWGSHDIASFITSLNSINKKRQSPTTWQEEFIANRELAISDEWLDTMQIDEIDRLIDAQSSLYKTNNNFGFFGRAMLRLIEENQRKAESLKPEYIRRLNELLDSLDETAKEKPIISKIQTAIDLLRFGEANAFLVQAEKGNIDITLFDQQTLGAAFTKFLDEYTHYYDDSLPSKNKRLVDFYTHEHTNKNAPGYESAVEFLSALPGDAGFSTKDSVRKLNNALGLQEPEIYLIRKDLCRIKYKEVHKTEFDHPIGAFGTRLVRKGFCIALLEGTEDLDELYKEIEKIREEVKSKENIRGAKSDSVSDTPTLLILVDGSIQKDVRRQLAGKFARNLNRDPFIIMDRVTALYIANFGKAIRWQQFLHCALPFQPENPYFTDPLAEIPPEMFVGRRSELIDILNTNVAKLVYGGRQLGKTALLRQARNLEKDPEAKKWASYVDIKDKNVTEASERIGKALQEGSEKFLNSSINKWTWNILIRELTKRLTFNEDVKDRFFLIIDEADAFLKSSERNNYSELDDLINLSNSTNNRFRFILAGLHNVMRFSSNGNNRIISKIPELNIEPLNFNDARELLEKPLSYLGYDFSTTDSDVIAQIIHAANYFPGLIHVYAHSLIKDKHNHFNSSTTPFYTLNRGDLLRLLQSKEFRNLRKDRLEMTLKLDEKESGHYYTLALLLADLYYSRDGQQYSRRGITAKELTDHAKDLIPNAQISKLSEAQLTSLMDELEQLYILRKEDDGEEVRYKFARTAFLEMLGRQKEVEDKLIEKMEEE